MTKLEGQGAHSVATGGRSTVATRQERQSFKEGEKEGYTDLEQQCLYRTAEEDKLGQD